MIGLTGPSNAGKGTVANYLKRQGATRITVLDGDDIHATAEFIKTMNGGIIVVDSLTKPAEIKYFMDKLDAEIIGVNAPLTEIYNRKRWTEGYTGNFEDFKKTLDNQQITECFHMSRRIIQNIGNLTDLQEKTDEALLSLGIGIKRIDRERG